MSYNVAWPDAEYHQVLPNLFLGGHVWEQDGREKGSRSSTVASDKSWNYVVSAYHSDFEESWPQCDQRLVLFKDTERGLDDDTWERIGSVVDEVTSRWQNGQKILLRCQAGYNRSGLLMGLVLMRLGFTAEDAILAARSRRGDGVLINSVFEGYVREREEKYRLPGNLAYTEAYCEDVAPGWMALLK